LFDNVMHDFPFVAGRGDIEKNKLVCTLFVVSFRAGHWVARVAKFFELYAFDSATSVDVEAGNDSFCEHSLNCIEASV
jgi:hypothetical protein